MLSLFLRNKAVSVASEVRDSKITNHSWKYLLATECRNRANHSLRKQNGNYRFCQSFFIQKTPTEDNGCLASKPEDQPTRSEHQSSLFSINYFLQPTVLDAICHASL